MIRIATHGDIPALARIHTQGWQAAYGGLVDQAYLDSLSVEDRAEKWREWMDAGESETLIAEEDGAPAGFVTYGRTKTAPPGSSAIRPTHAAEIYAIYLLPAYWRKGIGRTLLCAAAENLKAKKQTSLCLWVLDGNARAKAFYEKMGGQRIGKKMIEIGPNSLKEICYGWRDTAAMVS